jgi:hypothetical protein
MDRFRTHDGIELAFEEVDPMDPSALTTIR